MAGRQDVLDMLAEVGAERIPCGNVHMKFRLPNNKMFVAPSTPSDHLSWDNSLAQLRRELRQTHPQIANFRKNYTPPKSRRSYGELARMPGTTLSELLANHPHGFKPQDLGLEMPISAVVAIPGAQVVQKTEQVHFQIFEEPRPEPIVVEEVVRTHDSHKPPRIQHERRPKPAEAKTLTAAQLAEANRRLHDKGPSAMNAYLEECHDRMVPVTEEIARERRSDVSAQENSAGEGDSMNPMQGLVERAKSELDAVSKLIEGFDSEIEGLKVKRDGEILRQLKLEDFIGKYNKLIEESADLLQALPPLSVAEIQKIQQVPVHHGRGRHSKAIHGMRDPKEWFGMYEIRAHILPEFRRVGKTQFTVDDVMMELAKLPGKKLPSRAKMANTVYVGTKDKKPTYRISDVRGLYELVEGAA